MASTPCDIVESETNKAQLGERLTPLERAIERAHIDVAAIIRWTLFGIAAVLVALYPFFAVSSANKPSEIAKVQVGRAIFAVTVATRGEPAAANRSADRRD